MEVSLVDEFGSVASSVDGEISVSDVFEIVSLVVWRFELMSLEVSGKETALDLTRPSKLDPELSFVSDSDDAEISSLSLELSFKFPSEDSADESDIVESWKMELSEICVQNDEELSVSEEMSLLSPFSWECKSELEGQLRELSLTSEDEDNGSLLGQLSSSDGDEIISDGEIGSQELSKESEKDSSSEEELSTVEDSLGTKFEKNNNFIIFKTQ